MTASKYGADLAIEVTALRKTYIAGKEALRGVDLNVPRGAFYGVLGPNGAGKSTLINILGGLVSKSGGAARVLGVDIEEQPRIARNNLGVVPQELSLDPYFPARAALDLQAGLFGVPRKLRRTEELLDVLRLADVADRPARSLSGGMRRRLMVAKALVHRPPVLILDEPTAGVDVALRQQLWAYVQELNRSGTTILLTTHYLEEAEKLCSRIAVVADGQVVADDSTEALLRGVEDKALQIDVAEPLSAIPASFAEFAVTLLTPRRLLVRYGRSAGAVQRILAAVQTASLPIVDVTTVQPSLEDAFLALTRRGA